MMGNGCYYECRLQGIVKDFCYCYQVVVGRVEVDIVVDMVVVVVDMVFDIVVGIVVGEVVGRVFVVDIVQQLIECSKFGYSQGDKLQLCIELDSMMYL